MTKKEKERLDDLLLLLEDEISYKISDDQECANMIDRIEDARDILNNFFN